jgi:hypothetical protein
MRGTEALSIKPETVNGKTHRRRFSASSRDTEQLTSVSNSISIVSPKFVGADEPCGVCRPDQRHRSDHSYNGTRLWDEYTSTRDENENCHPHLKNQHKVSTSKWLEEHVTKTCLAGAVQIHG